MTRAKETGDQMRHNATGRIAGIALHESRLTQPGHPGIGSLRPMRDPIEASDANSIEPFIVCETDDGQAVMLLEAGATPVGIPYLIGDTEHRRGGSDGFHQVETIVGPDARRSLRMLAATGVRTDLPGTGEVERIHALTRMLRPAESGVRQTTNASQDATAELQRAPTETPRTEGEGFPGEQPQVPRKNDSVDLRPDSLSEKLVASYMQNYLFAEGLGYEAGKQAFQNTFGNPTEIGLRYVEGLLDAPIGKLLSRIGVDDSSSTASWVGNALLQEVVGKVKSMVMAQVSQLVLPSPEDSHTMLEGIDEFFNGGTSKATLGAVHDGHPDDDGNALKCANGSNVLVNGKLVGTAFSADTLVPDNGVLVDGSISVHSGGHWVSRKTSASTVPSTMTGASSNVLVGGDGPPPPAIAAAQKLLKDGQGKEQIKKAQESCSNATRAYQAAKRRGATEEEALRASEVASRAKPVSDKVGHELLIAAYKDGKEGVGTGKSEPLKEKVDKVVCEGETWVVEEIRDAETPGSDYPAGYRAVVFKRASDGQEVLVISGTNMTSGADWFNNLAQGFGFIPPQYEQAAKDAAYFQARNPGLLLMGHSLGGGLATYAGLMNGLPVLAFNPAGLGVQARANVASREFYYDPSQIQNYSVSRDILSAYANKYITPDLVGSVTILQGNPDATWVRNHQTGHPTKDEPIENGIHYGLGRAPIGHDVVNPAIPYIYLPGLYD